MRLSLEQSVDEDCRYCGDGGAGMVMQRVFPTRAEATRVLLRFIRDLPAAARPKTKHGIKGLSPGRS